MPKGVAFVATDEQRRTVETMAAFGIQQPYIAQAIGVSEDSLQRHFRAELDMGLVKANTKVAQNLYRMATGQGREALGAACFWLKTRAKWRETSEVRVTGKDGGAIETNGTDPEARSVLAELKAELAEMRRKAECTGT